MVGIMLKKENEYIVGFFREIYNPKNIFFMMDIKPIFLNYIGPQRIIIC
jgi:threonine/homoserine/homoserine lactone efflux protein